MSEALAAALGTALRRRVLPAPDAPVHGGSIHSCWRWTTGSGPVFVKCAPPGQGAVLDSEADGLARLARAGALRVPAVLATGAAEGRRFLVLEWLELRPPDAASDRRLGEALAALHRVTGRAYGLDADNYIGATPQPNTPSADWPAFWAARRLGHQLDVAERAGRGGALVERGRRLVAGLAAFFGGHRPPPSLLHGDLWSGNRAMLPGGEPVVYDPAVYHGDREAELAMCRLFGGFGRGFYAAYDAAWPPDPGAAARVELYQLYHVLNHWNLFGGGYGQQAESMIERLLAAAGG